MFGSTVLEVAIGIAFVYLLISLICSAINEGIASIINMRGKNLLAGIKRLLSDPTFDGLARQVFQHGLVAGVSKDPVTPTSMGRSPSYLASSTFSLALMDIIGAIGNVSDAATKWQQLAQKRQAEDVQATAAAAAMPANSTLQNAAANAASALSVAQQMLAKITALQPTIDQVLKQIASGQPIAVKPLSDQVDAVLALGRELGATFPDPLGSLEAGVRALPAGAARESLLALINKGKQDAALVVHAVGNIEQQVAKVGESIEQWYNNAMDRITGWYKRWTQRVLMAIAIVVVCVGNIDTVMLANRFSHDTDLRNAVNVVAEQAVQYREVKNVTSGDSTKALSDSISNAVRDSVLSMASTLNLPLGWKCDTAAHGSTAAGSKTGKPKAPDAELTNYVPCGAGAWGVKILGLLITIAAVSLGAPFWFDVLSKIINIRGTGTPPSDDTPSAKK